jgi:hypothetical protein
MRCFIKEDDIPFLSLILKNIPLVFTITQLDSASVREDETFLAVFISRYSVKKLCKRNNVVLTKFIKCPTDNKNFDSGVV